MIFVDKMNTEVTHIVLPAGKCIKETKRKKLIDTDKHNIVDRSLTYYLGILYGCFIVNEQCKHVLNLCIQRNNLNI